VLPFRATGWIETIEKQVAGIASPPTKETRSHNCTSVKCTKWVKAYHRIILRQRNGTLVQQTKDKQKRSSNLDAYTNYEKIM